MNNYYTIPINSYIQGLNQNACWGLGKLDFVSHLNETDVPDAPAQPEHKVRTLAQVKAGCATSQSVLPACLNFK